MGSGGQMSGGMNPCSSTSSNNEKSTKKQTNTQKLTAKQRLSAINVCRVASKTEASTKKRIKSFSSCVSQIGKTSTNNTSAATSSTQTPP